MESDIFTLVGTSRSDEIQQIRSEFSGLRTSLEHHMQYSRERDHESDWLAERKLLFTDISQLTGDMYKTAMEVKREIIEIYNL